MRGRALLCADHTTAVPDDPDIDIVLIPELCMRPRLMLPELEDADEVVLGLSGGAYSLGEVQRSVRSAGFDPFGVPIIDLREVETSDRLRLALHGALARAEAFDGSGPQHAKAILATDVSRRDVLRLPQPGYAVAPAIDVGLCAAGTGCRACVEVCPRTAYSWAGDRIKYDKSICDPCGLCVTTCPVGAITNPVTTAAQIAAQIGAIVGAASEPVGIVFACRDAEPLAEHGWFPVELPCVAMATPQWLLTPLLMGVGAVAAPPCSQSGCRLEYDDIVLGNVEYCTSLLAALGSDPARVRTAPGDGIPGPLATVLLEDPFATGRAPAVLTALAAAHGKSDVSMAEHPASPVGVVEIDPATCTGCTMCAQVCPTGALSFKQVDGEIEIGFDAADCTACGQCVPRCPERRRGAISLERRTDLSILQAGHNVLATKQAIMCERCGSPIAPAAMMDRISSLLGPEHSGVMSIIGRLCIDCRGAG